MRSGRTYHCITCFLAAPRLLLLLWPCFAHRPNKLVLLQSPPARARQPLENHVLTASVARQQGRRKGRHGGGLRPDRPLRFPKLPLDHGNAPLCCLDDTTRRCFRCLLPRRSAHSAKRRQHRNHAAPNYQEASIRPRSRHRRCAALSPSWTMCRTLRHLMANICSCPSPAPPPHPHRRPPLPRSPHDPSPCLTCVP